MSHDTVGKELARKIESPMEVLRIVLSRRSDIRASFTGCYDGGFPRAGKWALWPAGLPNQFRASY
jgi:hypothetical protein